MRPTAHQAIEYVVGLLLVYGAAHVPSNEATIELGVALACGVLAAISPGRLAIRSVLGRRSRRVGDAVVALGAVGGAVAARHELLAVAPLVFAAVILVKLALTPPFESEPRAPLLPNVESVQPHLNRAARVAGTFVRNRRNQKR